MMTLYEIVMKLVGPVQATGDHGADEKRLENLRKLMGLLDDLLMDMNDAAASETRPEASMKAIGKCAREWLEQWTE
jgi:hypothetical protein